MKILYKYFRTVIASLVIASLVQVGYIYAADSQVDSLSELVDAIENAVNGEHNVIEITGSQDITLSGVIDISGKDIEIKSNNGISLNSASGVRHFNVTAGGTLTIDNITLQGNGTNGGIDANGSSIYLKNGASINACYGENGGGIYAVGGNIDIDESDFISNTANMSGGGIYADGTTVTINNADIEDNTALGGIGGGIFATNSATVTVSGEDTLFRGNGTYTSGAGIAISDSSTLNIEDGTIQQNTIHPGNSGASGGGVALVAGSTLNMRGGTINYHDSNIKYGGGIYAASSFVNISGGTISDNHAEFGGGIYSEDPRAVNLTGDPQNFVFSGNTADSKASPTAKDFGGFHYRYLTGPGYFNNYGIQLFNNYDIYDTQTPYIIEFVMNGAEQNYDDLSLLDYETLDEEAYTPTRAGYVFKGWYTDEDLNPYSKWEFGGSFYADATLHARWLKTAESGQVTVKFDTLRNRVVDEQIVNIGDKVADPNYTDPYLNGWYTNKYGEGQKWNFNTDTVSVDTTLYAYYNADHAAQIWFDPNGGVLTTTNYGYDYIHVTRDTPIPTESILTAARENYTFDGWYTYLGVKWNFADNVTKDMRLIAKWIPNNNKEEPTQQFSVTFNMNGLGLTVGNQSKLVNEKVTEPSISYETNDYILYGFKYNGANWNFENDLVTGNMELVADWKPKYEVTFDTDGGTPANIGTQYVISGELTSGVSAPEKTGFTFVEWRLNGSKFDFSTPVTSNIGLVAYYEAEEIKKEEIKKEEIPVDPVKPVPPVTPVDEPVVSPIIPPLEEVANEAAPRGTAVTQNGVNYRYVQNPDNPQEYFIFDEDGTPLGSIIVPEGKTIEDMDIEAELTPLGVTVNKKENPKTGDFNYLLFMGTTVLSLVVLVLVQKKFRGDMY